MNNPILKKSIRSLRAASRKGGPAIWKALADELDKAKHRRITVNLSRINRHSETGDVVAVPGKVLGSGFLRHPVTIAAFSFSQAARRKIALAEGKTLFLTKLLEEEIELSKIKILK